MRYEEIEEWSKAAAEWSAAYFSSLRDQPVRSQAKPGEIAAKIAPAPPEAAESMAAIFDDFKSIIPGGMTHWQHPRFFAYFPSNAAPASIVAEQLVSTLAAQCMLWQTSPAATELETVMVDWLRQALGLPECLYGVLHDSATSATLSAVLTMRERALQWRGNDQGLSGCPPLRIYASGQNHSSIEKAVRIAGIGANNLVRIPTDATWAMRPEMLAEAIGTDRAQGFIPAGVIGCIGGTSIGASDRLQEILLIAREQQLTSHVDAAWAGSAMICPEFRTLWEGIELADSIVINPHKWLGASFDCSVQFLRHPEDQIRTLAIRPHYLQTFVSKTLEENVESADTAGNLAGNLGTQLLAGNLAGNLGTQLLAGNLGTQLSGGGGKVHSGLPSTLQPPSPSLLAQPPSPSSLPSLPEPAPTPASGHAPGKVSGDTAAWDKPLVTEHLRNYSEWTIPLGRRFRALKLWFLFRAYGLQGLRSRIRSHIHWASAAAKLIGMLPNVELTSPPHLSLFTFRLVPPGIDPELATRSLLEKINNDGRIYLTQTNLNEHFVIRFSIGQFETTWEDVELAVNVIQDLSHQVIETLSQGRSQGRAQGR